MFKLFRTCLLLLFIISTATASNSESTWISKKSDKSKKIEKVEKVENSDWIKKKKVKENKEKFKEKIKESKSWITKKSKEKIKKIKKNLKKYRDIESLAKAQFYFAAKIEPKENEEFIYFYGYVNSDTKSKKFEFNDKFYHSKSDGIAFLDDGKTTCEVDSQIKEFFGEMMGKVVVKCVNKLQMAGKFIQTGNSGKGIEGETNKGNNVEFEFYTSKNDAIAKLDLYKDEATTIITTDPKDKKIILDPNGKYYALLIGNSKYDDPKWVSLKSPVNDVKEISKILKKSYKFEKIITLTDSNRNEMFDAFDLLASITTDKDYILIYYSGHGDTKKNQAYWVPVDAPKKWSPRDWISIRDISVYIEDIKAQHLVLMVDSCYTGSAFKGSNKINKDNQVNLQRLAKKLLNSRARYVLSSGGNEPVIDSGVGKHSIFAKSFINSLNDSGFINMQQIAYNIAVAHSGMDQRPYFYSPETWEHAGGDFIFIPKKNLK